MLRSCTLLPFSIPSLDFESATNAGCPILATLFCRKGGRRRTSTGRSSSLGEKPVLRTHPLPQLPLRRLLHQVQRQQRHPDQHNVADPRVEPVQAEPVQNMRIVNQVPEIEVKQIKAVACLAYKD